MTQLRSVTCHMGSHSVTCHPTQVSTPALTPAMLAGTRFTYPGGLEGWVDLVDLIAPRPGVEPATLRSRVQLRSTNATSKTTKMIQLFIRRRIISMKSLHVWFPPSTQNFFCIN